MASRLSLALLVPALLLLPACDEPGCPGAQANGGRCDAGMPDTDGGDTDGGDTDGGAPPDAGGANECDTPRQARPCSDAPKSIQYCTDLYQWGECVDPETSCTPGDTREVDCGLGDEFGDLSYTKSCTLSPSGVPYWESYDEDACNTPLVLVPEGARPRFLPADGRAFAISGPAAACLVTDWPTADTPWLARDLDGNGSIDAGHELFGSGTALPSGRNAPHGFAALAPLDLNHDGIVDPRDPAFFELLLWADRDGDRRSTPDELTPLTAAGIFALPLDYSVEPACDARGNCSRERASVRAARPASLVDVYLPCR